ncbi:uncharacterized protein LOC109862384 [Pseudomyrmex gracilis]|uniref:uncharacterized protein LOC109862384 n=1 Tax=Pseudomyrmex gracilis TaxID=219809 RepID=UPI0009950B8E|nr:uncharacterized protein LOC109862384 [Pseudomyrmex gracilis]
MRTVVALCLLAVLCTVDANNLNILKAQVERSKTSVQNAVRQLERLRKNTEQDTVFKVKNKKIEYMMAYNDYNNRILAEISKKVKDANAKGKNAQPCYDNALNSLRDLRNTVTSDDARCVDIAQNSIKSEISFTDRLISTGNQLLGKLNNIFPSCYNNDILKMQNCITLELAKTNVAVRSLESDAKSAENTARSASSRVFLQANKCLSDVYNPAQSRITDIKLVADKCLRDL